MEKIKVGLLTMSDGREYLHEEYAQLNMDYQREIKEALESTGLFEVTAGDVPVHSNEEAKKRGQEAAEGRCGGDDLQLYDLVLSAVYRSGSEFCPGPLSTVLQPPSL